MDQHNIDPRQWFGDRFLDHVPLHFTVCKTPCNDKSKLWIYTKLEGRFAFVEYIDGDSLDNLSSSISVLALFTHGIPAFEDPNEALMYELTWA